MQRRPAGRPTAAPLAARRAALPAQPAPHVAGVPPRLPRPPAPHAGGAGSGAPAGGGGNARPDRRLRRRSRGREFAMAAHSAGRKLDPRLGLGHRVRAAILHELGRELAPLTMAGGGGPAASRAPARSGYALPGPAVPWPKTAASSASTQSASLEVFLSSS